MKKYRIYSLVLLFILSCITLELSAQVGINTDNLPPAGSAMLDVSSSDKGLLVPRISTEARNLIPSPATGLLIYNTTTNHYNYYHAPFWYQIEATFVSATTGTISSGGGTAISSQQDQVANSSAMLDVSDPGRGFLPVRTTQSAVIAPDNGLIIYDTDENILKYYFDNVWYPVCAVSTGTNAASGSQTTAGVAINTTGANPHHSAILEVTSQSKGLLIPRLTSSERDAVYPVAGLTIFNTTSKAIEFFNGTAWLRMNLILQAGVSISASALTVCAGTQVTFTPLPANGGDTPGYQWKVNSTAISGATNVTFTHIPVANDVVSCEMTSSSPCVTGNPAISNLITVTVNPLLPVSIAIAPSANPVCMGSSVTFSSNIINGGPSPLYQWKSAGTDIPGATNSTFTFAVLNNDIISCQLTSDALCASGSPAMSNSVILSVNPLLPVSLTISPSANPVCAGIPVNYTANIVNGGSAPAYQWKLNGANVNGATNPTYTNLPVNNSTVSCVLTSNAACATGTPATSNVITMTVNPLLPVSISVSPSANPVCAGTLVTYSSNINNGGANPSYQWKVNGTSVSGATNSTYTHIPVNTNAVSCQLTSNATCATGSPALSNVVNMTVNPLLPVSITVSPSANPVCAGTSVTFSSNIVNGGATPAYQWKLGSANITGATNATYTYIPVNNDVISCVLTSNALCATGTPATSNSVVMTVNPLLPVSITITPSANPVCAGTSVTYSSGIVNGGATPAYQWKVNGSNINGATNPTYTNVPVNNSTISCVLTSNAVCATGTPATSNVITMTVNPLLPVSIAVAASANPVCAGTSVTFISSINNGGANPSYQWKLNGTTIPGATNTTYTFVPVNTNAISCELTSNATCATGNPATSNVVTMTVNPLLPVSISISPSSNPVCAGTSVTYTSSIINGGAAPSYQWKLGSANITGATNATYTYVPVNNDAISCVLTSNAVCATGTPATSNTEVMTVHPLLPVSITIAESANPVCAGTSVTYTSAIVNGGSAPTYQWKLNGNIVNGATDASYTFVPANNNALSCVLVSNATCATGTPATSNVITMTVHPLLPVSITIAASANPVCAGTSVTFTSNEVNGGSSALYQWKLDGSDINGATNPTYTFVPVHGNVITCVLTSNATCAIGTPALSNAVTMTVNPLKPVSVVVAASANPVCAGTSVTYITSLFNGGPGPLFQWELNGTAIPGATNSAYTFVPVNNDAIYCVVTSNEICPTGNPATSNTVTMTVHPLLPVSITITASGNPVCAGTSVTYSSSIINGGPNPLYQWKLNGQDINGATDETYTYVPVDSDAISCVLTSDATCAINTPATSNVITMIVHPLLPVSVVVAPTANPVCAGTSVTFTATPTNGGPGPLYQWILNGTDLSGIINPTFTYTPVDGDAISCRVTSNAICPIGNPAVSNVVTMTVNPLLPVSVTIAPSGNPVCAGTSVTYTATPVNGGTTPDYQWKLNSQNIAGATNSTYTFVPLHNDELSVVLTSNAICPIGTPALSNSVIMTVHPLLPVSISITASINDICAGTSVTYNSSIVNGGANPLYQWKLDGSDIIGATNSTFTFIPANNNVITCKLTSNATCAIDNPALSNGISMIVHPLLPVSIVITPTANSICPGTQVTVNSDIVNGGSAPTYQWKLNLLVVPGATNPSFTFTPANNDLVTCTLTSNALCATGTPAISNNLTMTVLAIPPVGVTIAASAVVPLSPVTFTATPFNGGTAPSYVWKVNGNIMSGSSGSVFTYTPVTNDQILTVMTSVMQCAVGSPATSNTILIAGTTPVAVTARVTASANPVCAGTSVTFTATPVNCGTSPTYQWRLNGTNITGATNATYAVVPVHTNGFSCVVIPAAGTSVTTNTVTMSVIPLVTVSATITASLYAVMPGTPVTFTATPHNQGLAPTYQWKVNGVNVGTNSLSYTYTPANHDLVSFVLTSSNTASCLTSNPATSNVITMVVYLYGSACAGVPTVTYGGMTYNTVQIGTQCWLRENLNVGTRINGTVEQTHNQIVEKYCYDNNEANCNVYGGIYQWAEIVQYLNGASNTVNWNPVPSGNVQGICPSGWHIPTNTEWGTLMTSQGGIALAGGKLKEDGLYHFFIINTGGTNSSGFTSLPTGQRFTTGAFSFINKSVQYWTTTSGAAPATDVYYGGTSYSSGSATNGQFYKSTGIAVRCLKD